jgi:alkanesulfonate monooxygenase SsuD/methylene tetrahydromethanopterin reductase-like flavin-dependent oxidoreductase (luciferase family)
LLGAVGAVAPSLDLGTGVVALQLRTPMVVAMAGATLQALQPEREVLLGIGISSPVVTQRWHGVPYGDRPVARVREYVTLLRACLSGEKVDFAGDFYQFKGFRLGVRSGEPGPSGRGSAKPGPSGRGSGKPGPSGRGSGKPGPSGRGSGKPGPSGRGKHVPKIVIGALNPAMLRLAGEVADGVLLNYLPASHVPWSVEQVRKGGAARAAAGAGMCAIYAYVHAGVCERDEGIELARRDLYSYALVDSYARNFERAGFADEVAEIRERFAAGDREGAVGAVSDRMVDAIDVMGDADVAHATMQSYVDAGVEVPILMPLPWGRDRRASADATIRAAIGKG